MADYSYAVDVKLSIFQECVRSGMLPEDAAKAANAVFETLFPKGI